MRTERQSRSGEHVGEKAVVLGEPQFRVSLPEIQLVGENVVFGLPFMPYEGQTMRLPNGKKIGRAVKASVPLRIPSRQFTSVNQQKNAFDRFKHEKPSQPKPVGQKLADTLLETQIHTANGVQRQETVCHFPYETFACLFHPEFEQKIREKTGGTSNSRNKLPSVQQAYRDRQKRVEAQYSAASAGVEVKEATIKNELERIKSVGRSISDAAAAVLPNGEISPLGRQKLQQIRKMFRSSDFSAKDLIGPSGVILHQDFLETFDFELSLDPLSPQRAALLELTQVVPEASVPGLHLLVRELAAYDQRRQQKNKLNFQQEEADFFKELPRKVSQSHRDSIVTMRKKYTEYVKAEVRNQRLSKSMSSEALLSSLMAFHEVDCNKNSPYIVQQAQLIRDLSGKNISEMNHEEITFLLSVEFEKTTSASQVFDANDPLFAKVTELNEAGLYYFNMDFYAVHDPNTFHGAFVTLPDGSVAFDWCPIHTPALDLQLSNISFTPSVPAIPAAPAFSIPSMGIDVIGGATVGVGQGLSLFAQAFALGGAGLVGGVFAGSAGAGRMKPSKAAAKPQSADKPQKKPVEKSAPRSVGGNVRSAKVAAPPVKPEAKVDFVPPPRKKTIEKQANTTAQVIKPRPEKKSSVASPKELKKPQLNGAPSKARSVSPEKVVFVAAGLKTTSPAKATPKDKIQVSAPSKQELRSVAQGALIPSIVLKRPVERVVRSFASPLSRLDGGRGIERTTSKRSSKNNVFRALIEGNRRSEMVFQNTGNRTASVDQKSGTTFDFGSKSLGVIGNKNEQRSRKTVTKELLGVSQSNSQTEKRSEAKFVAAPVKQESQIKQQIKNNNEKVQVKHSVSKRQEKVTVETTSTKRLEKKSVAQKEALHLSSQAVQKEKKSSVATSKVISPVTSTEKKELTTRSSAKKASFSPAKEKKQDGRADAKVSSSAVKTSRAEMESKSRDAKQATQDNTGQKATQHTQEKVKISDAQTEIAKSDANTRETTNPSSQSTGENVVSITVAVVGGAVQAAVRGVNSSRAREKVVRASESPVIAATTGESTKKTDVVHSALARRQGEYGFSRGGGGGSAVQSKPRSGRNSSSATAVRSKSTIPSTKKTKPMRGNSVQNTTLLSLPTDVIVDVGNSFGTAREVRAWALEAWSNPPQSKRQLRKAA